MGDEGACETMSWMKLILIVYFSFSALPSMSCTLELPIEGAIGPATLDLIERGLLEAKKKNCTSIMLSVNTPGGNLQSTRLIVATILNSDIPFLCLVHPNGAHAGSAGAIIMQACHVSGAFPATNIGAATPILGTGQEMPEDLRKKIINDAVSWLKGLTDLRGRNEDFGRDIITDAKAVNAQEALQIKAIEYVGSDIPGFLEFSAGRQVTMAGKIKKLVQVGPIKKMKLDMRFQVLQMVSDPEISYMMFMGSLGLLYFEITHPGTIVPGVLGSIGLVLSLISFHKMDVYWGGLALILIGIILFVLEVYVPSFGALGAGGSVAFILGSLFLFNPQSGYSLPLVTILGTASVLIAVLSGIVLLALSSRKVRLRTAYDDLPDAEGEVIRVSTNGLKGQVRVIGEIWKFKSLEAFVVGEKIKVKGHQGLTLNIIKRSSK